MSSKALFDCAVVGAGPAGLTAALYMARYCREVIVLHDGTSRALKAPMAHNVPGFPGGVSGQTLIASMFDQTSRHGATILETEVWAAATCEQGFRLDTASGPVVARTVILATGVEVLEADLPREIHDEAVRIGTLRYCPICDGYEARGKRIAVLGSHTSGAAEALFLRQYSDDVSLIPRDFATLSDDERRQLTRAQVNVVETPVEKLRPRADGMEVVTRDRTLVFSVLYPALGCRPRSRLAHCLSIEVNEAGCVPAGDRMTTRAPGVFVAGDVVEALDQISVAIGQGAIAATSAHNWLRDQDRESLQS